MNILDKKNITKILDLWKSANLTSEPIEEQIQLEIINQIASAFTVGKFYYMVFNFNDLSIKYVDPGVKSILGIDPIEFDLSTFFNVVHPDDLTKLHAKEAFSGEFLYEKILKEEISHYKVVYMIRLKSKDGEYKTILHQSRAINVSEDGKIQQVLTVHSDVTFLDIPFNDNISFISQYLPSFFASEKEGKYCFNKKLKRLVFTKRETDIIKKIAEGKTYTEIAEELFISKNTISFHRKNILRKSECNNSAQLIARCVREGII